MNKRIPAYPFPVNEFYKSVALAIEETMEAIQAPDALVATSFLTGMSIACQSDVEVMLPHELAVNWANTIGSRIEAIKAEIEASRYPTHADEPEVQTAPAPEAQPAIQPESIA